jgi:FkbM family methyltransferase
MRREPPDGTYAGTFGGGLRFEGNPVTDANVRELLLLRFASPALAPVLDAALEPGDVFADVGANLGLYALWGARRVGPTGSVVAFEPVPETRARLERNLALNGFRNVEVVAAGVGAEAGEITLYRHPVASGVASRYEVQASGRPIDVPVTTLDDAFATRPRPRLVKVDVEGMELEVLRGARALLGGDDPPALVLEANPPHLAAAGTSYADLGAFLAGLGYELWALRPSGLRREPAGAAAPGSLNVLATRPDSAAHRRALERLAGQRFARNMNA